MSKDTFLPIPSELQASINKLNKETSDTLYGYLFEPLVLMNYAVALEYPEISEQGIIIANSCELLIIEAIERQVEYYLKHVPVGSQSRYLVESFFSTVKEYVAKYSGQLIPKSPPSGFIDCDW